MEKLLLYIEINQLKRQGFKISAIAKIQGEVLDALLFLYAVFVNMVSNTIVYNKGFVTSNREYCLYKKGFN
ncbi:hypothetical protein ACFPA1_08415 [Neobacillus sp. GCM10023253]|uniref:hypothetical protein n=1 Tax=Neobacillus sp. GCM10023253 TaxID=3252644 RepID=UPI003607F595